MHSLLSMALTTTFLLAPNGPGEKADSQAQTDNARLQGRWVLVAIDSDGELEKCTEEDGSWSCEFCKTSFTFSAVGREFRFQSLGSYRLHADRNPPVMELTFGGGSMRASYKLDGDTLVVAKSKDPEQPPPTGFQTRPGDGRDVRIFKRKTIEAPAIREEMHDPPPVRRERAQLEGVWLVVETENKGERCRAGSKDWLSSVQLEFKGDVVEAWFAVGKASWALDGAGTYAVLPGQNPKGLDFTWTSKSEGEEDQVAHAIYTVEGDTLTVCMTTGKERPTSFDTRRDSDWVVMVCKRKKP